MFVNCFLTFLTLALKMYQKHINFKCNSSKLSRYFKFIQYFFFHFHFIFAFCISIFSSFFLSAFCSSQCYFGIIGQTKRSSFHNCQFIVERSETARKQFSFGHTPAAVKFGNLQRKKSFFTGK